MNCFRDATPSEEVWEQTQSRMFGVLDGYQVDGYRNLLKIAADFGGAQLSAMASVSAKPSSA